MKFAPMAVCHTVFNGVTSGGGTKYGRILMAGSG